MRQGLFKFFASLKLAVFSILLLAVVLATATVCESLYGMRAAHVLVYGTYWFAGVLLLLSTNVLCAALIRYPWKKRQIGFVVTHTGILILVFGSFLTQQFGVDGNLPIVEGQADNEVVLNDLQLGVYEEAAGTSVQIPVPETAIAASGKLLRVSLSPTSSLLVDKFYPRALTTTQVTPSPLNGVGTPSLHLELFNQRFRVSEWVFADSPAKPGELNLGPAIIHFQKLWKDGDENLFFHPPKDKTVKNSAGTLVVTYQGGEHRLVIPKTASSWMPIAGTDLEAQFTRYLPYAIVENNQLVSKSNDPVNPAVELKVRQKETGISQVYTVFANFPEFSTLHGGHKNGDKLGLKLQMVSNGNAGAENRQQLSILGNRRGLLEFAQSADDKHLLYRVVGANGNVNGSGEVKPDQVVRTGWMDLQFRVSEWYPSGVSSEVPKPIEYIQGQGTDNFLSAVHLVAQNARGVASSEDGQWLMEGSGKLFAIDGKDIFVNFAKKRLSLPFNLFLNKFTIVTDPGTNKAASYESQVTVKDPANGVQRNALIKMNEPLKYGGYTFYQASYQTEEGRPPVSVFAVNYDPGRPIKYAGALCMVFGILIMFYMNPHYFDLIVPKRRPA